MYPESSNLKTGNVIFCSTKNSFEAEVIRLVLQSPWNHVAMVEIENGLPFIIEATGSTGNVCKTPYAAWCLQLEREVELVPVECDASLILNLIGTRYDYWSCINHLWYRILGNWYGAKAGRGARKLYCFEAAAYIYNMPEWWKATPADLYHYLSKIVKTPQTA